MTVQGPVRKSLKEEMSHTGGVSGLWVFLNYYGIWPILFHRPGRKWGDVVTCQYILPVREQ